MLLVSAAVQVGCIALLPAHLSRRLFLRRHACGGRSILSADKRGFLIRFTCKGQRSDLAVVCQRLQCGSDLIIVGRQLEVVALIDGAGQIHALHQGLRLSVVFTGIGVVPPDIVLRQAHVVHGFQRHFGLVLNHVPAVSALVLGVDVVAGVGNRGDILVQLRAVEYRTGHARSLLRDAAADGCPVIVDRAGQNLRRAAVLIDGAALASGGIAGNFGARGYDQIAAVLIDGAAVGRSLVVFQFGMG